MHRNLISCLRWRDIAVMSYHNQSKHLHFLKSGRRISLFLWSRNLIETWTPKGASCILSWSNELCLVLALGRQKFLNLALKKLLRYQSWIPSISWEKFLRFFQPQSPQYLKIIDLPSQETLASFYPSFCLKISSLCTHKGNGSFPIRCSSAKLRFLQNLRKLLKPLDLLFTLLPQHKLNISIRK